MAIAMYRGSSGSALRYPGASPARPLESQAAPMRRPDSGLTLIELLILAGLLWLLAACLAPNGLAPNVDAAQDRYFEVADAANLRCHYVWFLFYKRKHNGSLPEEGGHKFVMTTWAAGIYDHTPENFDRFWTPGPAKQNDANYADLRKLVLRGENPWPSLAQTSSLDTHYVGRSRQHFETRESSAEEAWMADDNEGGWNLRDGTINVLFCDGFVRTYSYPQLQEQFGLGPFDRDHPVVTWGPDSPIEACRKLAN